MPTTIVKLLPEPFDTFPAGKVLTICDICRKNELYVYLFIGHFFLLKLT